MVYLLRWESGFYIDPFGLEALKTLGEGVFGGINGVKGSSYGGNQKWFELEWQKGGGCGPTAAANTLAYMSQSSPIYISLYPYSDFSEKNFGRYMHRVINTVTPGHVGDIAAGIRYMREYRDKVIEYAAGRGIELNSYAISSWNDNPTNILNFLEGAIAKDLPVTMLIGIGNGMMKLEESSNADTSLYMHYVTVTEVFRDTEDNPQIRVSSWGREYTFDFYETVNKSNYVGATYFQYASGKGKING